MKWIIIVLLTVAVIRSLLAADLIKPGDRLEVKYHGPSWWGSQLSVVDTNGKIRIAKGAYVSLQGISPDEAATKITKVPFLSDGNTNKIESASVRLIAPVPPPLKLNVLRRGESNVVFRLTNTTTNTYRVPSAGYARSDYYTGINTNPAYAIFIKPETDVGLWLTRDWRYVGNDWMMASRDEWANRLKIQAIPPSSTLDIVRDLGLWAAPMLTNEDAVVRFNFEISQEWAEAYDLWEGFLTVTGLIETTTEPTKGSSVRGEPRR